MERGQQQRAVVTERAGGYGECGHHQHAGAHDRLGIERFARKQAGGFVARIEYKENGDAGKPGKNKHQGNQGARFDAGGSNRRDAQREAGERKGRKVAWALPCPWALRFIAQKRDAGDCEDDSGGGENQKRPAPRQQGLHEAAIERAAKGADAPDNGQNRHELRPYRRGKIPLHRDEGERDERAAAEAADQAANQGPVHGGRQGGFDSAQREDQRRHDHCGAHRPVGGEPSRRGTGNDGADFIDGEGPAIQLNPADIAHHGGHDG